MLEVPEVMPCVRLCMLEAVEGVICLREVSEVLQVLEVSEAMRCVLFCMLEAVGGGLYLLDAMRRAVLYAGGRGG